jgi:hypothetical protein
VGYDRPLETIARAGAVVHRSPNLFEAMRAPARLGLAEVDTMKQLVSMKRPSGFEAVAPEARLSLMEARHRELESRLKELGRRPYLTPREQLEAADIKKRKLLAKDAIATLKRAV